MRISMFNCDVHQTLSFINSAAVSLKIIKIRLTVFLRPQICPAAYIFIRPVLSFAAEESASWEHWGG
jgi:hypothetical protein